MSVGFKSKHALASLLHADMAMIFHCGFARAAVLHSTFTEPKQGCKRLTKISSTWKQKLNRFRDFFGELPSQMAAEFDLDNKTFRTRAPSITDMFSKWKGSERQAYIDKFSKDSWEKLDEQQKLKHSMSNCKECIKIPENNSFPINNSSLKVLKQNPLHKKNIKKIALEVIDAQPQNTLSESGHKRAAKELFLEVGKIFQDYYKSDLAETLAKIPELGLQLRKKTKDYKNKYQKFARKIKQNMEEHWSKIETATFLGNRQSHSQRDKLRKALSFESQEEATERTRRRREMENSGLRKVRRACFDPNNLEFDKAALLDEVKAYPVGKKVVYHSMSEAQSC